MLNKTAQPKAVTEMTGRLIYSRSGWVLLEVPNAIVHGVFNSLMIPGAELPLNSEGKLRAHISVLREEEVTAIGGPAKINEFGKTFKYQLGPLFEVNPYGWDDYDRVWFLSVKSPQLSAFRKSYGLSPQPMRGRKEMRFHITVARRKRGVLRPNPLAKG